MTHKRHWLCTAAMVLIPVLAPIKVLASADRMPSPELGGGHATARVHYPSWRCGGCMADCGACAAADNAGNRIYPRRVSRYQRALGGCVPQGPQRNRLRRRPERDGRVPLA